MLRVRSKSRFGAKFSLGLMLAACLQAISSLPARADTLFFGVVPQQSATRLAEMWVPFLNALEERTGLSITFATAKDIPTFELCLLEGAYDIAYMNPYHYVAFHDTSGYRAFAKQADKALKGVLVTRRDSGIQSLEDLNKAEVAFPSPAAFGASVLPRAEMAALGIEIEPVYVKSHDSVYRAVDIGLFPAGGGVLRTFESLPEDLKSRLHVFHETAAYTPHAFAAAPRVDPEVVDHLAEVMAGFDDTRILEGLAMKGVVRAGDDDWDDVRALNLSKEQTDIRSEGASQCHSG
ncbi:phosphate ABC transporter substrate-binding protein [Roseibium aquae]|uniref:Phosphate ABC transporter substrate-binding protein n=1 Tax=Roseibium aquae TaxID=1323746 RepID=A0A916TL68_9HYPH|nr:phosphate/phosphite/phosphonate ABC transporter substrate-binding protein [Roseibium aquae]GGB49512.1 phosphate ABC transporter substrate-binding protein [Roseibium aquae]